MGMRHRVSDLMDVQKATCGREIHSANAKENEKMMGEEGAIWLDWTAFLSTERELEDSDPPATLLLLLASNSFSLIVITSSDLRAQLCSILSFTPNPCNMTNPSALPPPVKTTSIRIGKSGTAGKRTSSRRREEAAGFARSVEGGCGQVRGILLLWAHMYVFLPGRRF